MEMKRFLEKLSSDAPTPGGGSASALAGALSAALISMTAGLSLKKGQLKGEKVREIRSRALRIQERLLRAIREDSDSYEAVLRAFRLPKETEGQRRARIRAIQKAFQGATVTPRLVCQRSVRLLEDALILLQKGNPSAISDAGVAAYLADTAIKGGLLNIGINLSSIRSRTFKKRMHSFAKGLEKRRDRLLRRVQKSLSQSLSV